MNRKTRLWNLWYPWAGMIAASAISWHFRMDTRVFHGSVSTSVFSGLLTFSALLVTVLLALLAIIASLDSREIVRAIRKAGHYSELVQCAFSPLVAFVSLAMISLSALLLRTDDSETLRRVVVMAALGISGFGMLSTIRFARLLVRVMIDPVGNNKSWDQSNTPEGARRRGAGDVSIEKTSDTPIGNPITASP